MHRDWKKRVRAGIVLASLALSAAENASAIGTLSGISVDNRATVEYAVGATTQPVIESSPAGNTTTGAGNGLDTSFLVDNRVDLTVAEFSGGYTVVASGGTSEVLVYTVANTGNTVQDFSLAATDLAGGADPFGGVDNFDAAAIGIFVDANNDGLYDAGDTATYIDELAADDDVEVFVVRNIGVRANGDISAVILTAQVAQGGVATTQGADILTDDAAAADLPGTVQIVFGDGASDGGDVIRNGRFGDTDAYRVGAAQITVAKSSAVISDPINLGVNPKAIPGAVVEYTVTISNDAAASAAATNVQVTDSLNAEITALTVAFDANGYGAAAGMQVTSPNIAGGVATALSNAADLDQGDFTANVVTVGGISLLAGESATVRFRVVIQ